MKMIATCGGYCSSIVVPSVLISHFPYLLLVLKVTFNDVIHRVLYFRYSNESTQRARLSYASEETDNYLIVLTYCFNAQLQPRWHTGKSTYRNCNAESHIRNRAMISINLKNEAHISARGAGHRLQLERSGKTANTLLCALIHLSLIFSSLNYSSFSSYRPSFLTCTVGKGLIFFINNSLLHSFSLFRCFRATLFRCFRDFTPPTISFIHSFLFLYFHFTGCDLRLFYDFVFLS